jgi:predicted MFS family arabinose efflux permease
LLLTEWLSGGLGVKEFWIGMGTLCLINAVLLYAVTPRERPAAVGGGGLAGLLRPYKIVFSNPQSYLCGIVAGLLFAPTTIGAMIWAVPIFQKDIQLSFHSSVFTASLVPLGWVIGCPLLGWISDRIGRRKPVIIGGAAIMAILAAQLQYGLVIPIALSMLLFGVASGAAMIPYSVIKEVNPDNVKGSATGALNFLVFGITKNSPRMNRAASLSPPVISLINDSESREPRSFSDAQTNRAPFNRATSFGMAPSFFRMNVSVGVRMA